MKGLIFHKTVENVFKTCNVSANLIYHTYYRYTVTDTLQMMFSGQFKVSLFLVQMLNTE
jgi:hypothetical protein